MITYKLQNDRNGNTVSVFRSDGWSIPLDTPDNTDYQQFLAWVAEGNQPEPAEEQ